MSGGRNSLQFLPGRHVWQGLFAWHPLLARAKESPVPYPYGQAHHWE